MKNPRGKQRLADLEKRHRDPLSPLRGKDGKLRYIALSPRILPEKTLSQLASKYRSRLSLAVNAPELAKAAGLPYASVYAILTAIRPRTSFVAGMRLAAALGLSPYEMLRILHPEEAARLPR